ncbi:hypothetical protein RCL1_005227 [Eukaryota sp. TZLM3-RCL]
MLTAHSREDPKFSFTTPNWSELSPGTTDGAAQSPLSTSRSTTAATPCLVDPGSESALESDDAIKPTTSLSFTTPVSITGSLGKYLSACISHGSVKSKHSQGSSLASQTLQFAPSIANRALLTELYNESLHPDPHCRFRLLFEKYVSPRFFGHNNGKSADESDENTIHLPTLFVPDSIVQEWEKVKSQSVHDRLLTTSLLQLECDDFTAPFSDEDDEELDVSSDLFLAAALIKIIRQNVDLYSKVGTADPISTERIVFENYVLYRLLIIYAEHSVSMHLRSNQTEPTFHILDSELRLFWASPTEWIESALENTLTYFDLCVKLLPPITDNNLLLKSLFTQLNSLIINPLEHTLDHSTVLDHLLGVRRAVLNKLFVIANDQSYSLDLLVNEVSVLHDIFNLTHSLEIKQRLTRFISTVWNSLQSFLSLPQLPEISFKKLFSIKGCSSISATYFPHDSLSDTINSLEILSQYSTKTRLSTLHVTQLNSLMSHLKGYHQSPLLPVVASLLSLHYLSISEYENSLSFVGLSLKYLHDFPHAIAINLDYSCSLLLFCFAVNHSLQETLECCRQLYSPVQPVNDSSNRSSLRSLRTAKSSLRPRTTGQARSNSNIVLRYHCAELASSFDNSLMSAAHVGILSKVLIAFVSNPTYVSVLDSLRLELEAVQPISTNRNLVNLMMDWTSLFVTDCQIPSSQSDAQLILLRHLRELRQEEILCVKSSPDVYKILVDLLHLLISCFEQSSQLESSGTLLLNRSQRRGSKLAPQQVSTILQMYHESKLLLEFGTNVCEELSLIFEHVSDAILGEILSEKKIAKFRSVNLNVSAVDPKDVAEELEVYVWSLRVSIVTKLLTLLALVVPLDQCSDCNHRFSILIDCYNQRPFSIPPSHHVVNQLWTQIELFPRNLVVKFAEDVCTDLLRFNSVDDSSKLDPFLNALLTRRTQQIPDYNFGDYEDDLFTYYSLHPLVLSCLSFLASSYIQDGAFDYCEVLFHDALDFSLALFEPNYETLQRIWNQFIDFKKNQLSAIDFLAFVKKLLDKYLKLHRSKNKFVQIVQTTFDSFRNDQVTHLRHLYEKRKEELLLSEKGDCRLVLQLNHDYVDKFMKRNAFSDVSEILLDSLKLVKSDQDPTECYSLWKNFCTNQFRWAEVLISESKEMEAVNQLILAMRTRPSVLPLHDTVCERLFKQIMTISDFASNEVYSFVEEEYISIVNSLRNHFSFIDDLDRPFASSVTDLEHLRSILKSFPHFPHVLSVLSNLHGSHCNNTAKLKVVRLRLWTLTASLPPTSKEILDVWSEYRTLTSHLVRSTHHLLGWLEDELLHFSKVLPSKHPLLETILGDFNRIQSRLKLIEKWTAVFGYYMFYLVLFFFYWVYLPPLEELIRFWNRETAWTYWLLYSVEFGLLIAALYFVRYPALPADNPSQRKLVRAKRSRDVQEVALLITTHKSSKIIEKTLRAALLIFPPHAIYICDNGNSPIPLDETKAVVHSVDPAINYNWCPIGNKTISSWWLSKYIIKHKYVLTTDDDVVLPVDFIIPMEEFLDHTTKCLAFTIRAENLFYPNGKRRILTNFQDLEYKIAAVFKLFQSLSGTTLCPHGALSLWDRETFVQVSERHDASFNGEDLQLGLILHELNKNFRIATVGRVSVCTEVPDHFICRKLLSCDCPSGASLVKQRLKSWDVTGHRFIFRLFALFSFYWKKRTVILKPFLLFEMWTVLMDWIRVFLLYFIISRNPANFFVGMGLVHVIYTAFLVVFNYWTLRDRADLRSPLTVILLFPFYRYFLLGFRGIALLVNLLWYTPFNRNKPPISERQDLPLAPFSEDSDETTVEDHESVTNSVNEKDNSLGTGTLQTFVEGNLHSFKFSPLNDWLVDLILPYMKLSKPALHTCFKPRKHCLLLNKVELEKSMYISSSKHPAHFAALLNVLSFLLDQPLCFGTDLESAILLLYWVQIYSESRHTEQSVKSFEQFDSMLSTGFGVKEFMNLLFDNLQLQFNRNSFVQQWTSCFWIAVPSQDGDGLLALSATLDTPVTLDPYSPLSRIYDFNGLDPLVLVVPLNFSFSIPTDFSIVVVHPKLKSVLIVNSPSSSMNNVYFVVKLLDSIESSQCISSFSFTDVTSNKSRSLTWASILHYASRVNSFNKESNKCSDSTNAFLPLMSVSSTFSSIYLDSISSVLKLPVACIENGRVHIHGEELSREKNVVVLKNVEGSLGFCVEQLK